MTHFAKKNSTGMVVANIPEGADGLLDYFQKLDGYSVQRGSKKVGMIDRGNRGVFRHAIGYTYPNAQDTAIT